MRTKTNLNVSLAFLFVAVAAGAALVISPTALAGKGDKGKPGGGGDGGGTPTPTGEVYIASGGLLQAMDADGANGYSLPANVFGEPSHALHGGMRWFIDVRDVAGAYPDGTQRQELFAVREDGDESFTVQLTNDANMKAGEFHAIRWGTDASASPAVVDGLISWSAVRWDGNTGEVIEAGVYSSQVFFDNDGNVAGNLAPVLEVAGGAYEEFDIDWEFPEFAMQPDIFGHDWSPDGTALVHSQRSLVAGNVARVVVVNFLTMRDWELSENGESPVWSPDGAKIAFSDGGVVTINPDGTGRQTVLANRSRASGFTSFDNPEWSPQSTHFIFRQMDYKAAKDFGQNTTDVYVCQIDGSQPQNLTSNIDARVLRLWLGDEALGYCGETAYAC